MQKKQIMSRMFIGGKRCMPVMKESMWIMKK